MKPLGWTLINIIGVLIKRKNLDPDTYTRRALSDHESRDKSNATETK
jgi:hypothetical protein